MVDPKQRLKDLAYQAGFLSVGFAKSDFLADEEPRLVDWLKKDQQGEMKYMENHFDMRLDPRILVPDSKTVVSFLYNYFPNQTQIPETYKISKYAYGEDYHFVIKDKLKNLIQTFCSEFGAIEGRVFVDSAPVLEKAWAKKSGLGWIGKNSNLIQPKTGSFFFLAEWICDFVFKADFPIRDYCGTCTKCIDACPTNAIVEPYKVDGSKCISYATIELKTSQLPDYFKNNMSDWMYGCDICQDVCPWNRFSKPHNEPRFNPNEYLLNLSKSEWEALDDLTYREIFRKSPVKRTKFEGLKRNIQFIRKY